MLTSVKFWLVTSGLSNGKKQSSPDHAVWGWVGRGLLRLGLGALLVLAASSMAQAGSKLSADLQQLHSGGDTDVIVQFKRIPQDADLRPFAASQIKTRYRHMKAVHLKLPAAAIRALESNPLVTYVSPNRPIHGALDITTQAVNANLVWQNFGLDGTGVGVAIIDSGIASHPDIKSRIVYSKSFIPGLNASDQYGHGTHVAGIVGGNGANSTGNQYTRTFKGVAPNVNLINLRVLDQNGAGYDSNLIAAIDAAISLRTSYNIRIINLSLGRPVFESYTLDPVCQAVEQAWNAGIVVVVAAGNNGRDDSLGTHGYGTIASPGNDPWVITVGATKTLGTPSTADDSIATFSSKGPTLLDHIVKPDLVAPGNNIVSLMANNCTLVKQYPSTKLPGNYYFTPSPPPPPYSNSYFQLSGTSMATPVVSGAAALLLQANPALTPDQVKARLMKTAAKTYPLYSTGVEVNSGILFNNQADIFTMGAGYLDINAALNNADLVTVPAISPQAVLYNNQVYIVFAQNVIWGTPLNFATNVVWGTSNQWAFNIVWGTTEFSATSAAGLPLPWGASTADWGNAAVGAQNVIWGTTANPSSNLQNFASDDGDR
jgi:serine protease AprX